MEPANLHHYHQEDDHHVPVDSSSFSIPSCYALSWSQNPLLINSRNLAPCLDNNIDSMAQELGFPWSSTSNNNGVAYPIDNFIMTHELQRLARIKDEFSVTESYPKFLDMLNCSPTSSIEDLQLHPSSSSYLKNDHHQQISYSNNNQDFLLRNLSSNTTGCDQIKGGQLIINDQNCSNGIFSQIFPTLSISSLNQSSSNSSSSSSSSSSGISSSSFDMNSLPALDLFGSPRFDPSSLNSHINLGGLPYGLNGMHQQSHRPSLICPSKIPSVSTNGSTDQPTKRPASKYIDTKATQSLPVKKSKLESRPSAPFQVRKEKLGDRIAAIQQLVAPFGKTDTASVLMEAIGYIKFLQTQVETLSVPYMKSIDKTSGMPTNGGHLEEGNKETNKDLKSRGLCLVPLSCLSYITGGSEGIWPGP